MSEKATGGFVSYYLADVPYPQRAVQPYSAECEDIIRALKMTWDEACEFKAIWRTAAARLGNRKPGHDAVYDAEKRVHYAQASLRCERLGMGAAAPNTPKSLTVEEVRKMVGNG